MYYLVITSKKHYVLECSKVKLQEMKVWEELGWWSWSNRGKQEPATSASPGTWMGRELQCVNSGKHSKDYWESWSQGEKKRSRIVNFLGLFSQLSHAFMGKSSPRVVRWSEIPQDCVSAEGDRHAQSTLFFALYMLFLMGIWRSRQVVFLHFVVWPTVTCAIKLENHSVKCQ